MANDASPETKRDPSYLEITAGTIGLVVGIMTLVTIPYWVPRAWPWVTERFHDVFGDTTRQVAEAAAAHAPQLAQLAHVAVQAMTSGPF